MNTRSMRAFLITTFLGATLLAGASNVNGQVSVGIRIGPPPATRVVRTVPRSPGPGYVWVDGYWYPVGNHYKWHDGYWTRPPYPGETWVRPRYDGHMFYQGYWTGPRGRYEHDHRRDNDHNRDYRADHDRPHSDHDR
jgi:hypothetical protein